MRIREQNEAYTDPLYAAARRQNEEIVQLLYERNGTEFTPVGVGWRRVERSYPLAKMIRRVTGLKEDDEGELIYDPNATSEYSLQVHVDAAEGFAQAQWLEQGAVGRQASPQVARMAHDLGNPQVFLIHEEFFRLGADGAIAIQRHLSELGFSSLEEAAASSAVKLVCYVPEDRVKEGVTAETYFRALIDAANKASQGAARLQSDWFTVTSAAVLDFAVSAALGPADWLQSVPNARVKVSTGTAPARAFHVAVESAATGDALAQDILAQLNVAQNEGGWLEPAAVTQSQQMVARQQQYQQTVEESVGDL
jgi:hypothetical protein